MAKLAVINNSMSEKSLEPSQEDFFKETTNYDFKNF